MSKPIPINTINEKKEKLIFEAFDILGSLYLSSIYYETYYTYPLILSGIYNLAEISAKRYCNKDEEKGIEPILKKIITDFPDSETSINHLNSVRIFFRNPFTHDIMAQELKISDLEIKDAFCHLIKLIEFFFQKTLGKLEISSSSTEVGFLRTFLTIKCLTYVYKSNFRREKITNEISRIKRNFQDCIENKNKAGAIWQINNHIRSNFPKNDDELLLLMRYDKNIKDNIFKVLDENYKSIRSIHQRIAKNGFQRIPEEKIINALSDLHCIGEIDYDGSGYRILQS